MKIKDRRMDINVAIREQYDMKETLLQCKTKTIYVNNEEHFYLFIKVSFYLKCRSLRT